MVASLHMIKNLRLQLLLTHSTMDSLFQLQLSLLFFKSIPVSDDTAWEYRCHLEAEQIVSPCFPYFEGHKVYIHLL